MILIPDSFSIKFLLQNTIMLQSSYSNEYFQLSGLRAIYHYLGFTLTSPCERPFFAGHGATVQKLPAHINHYLPK